MSKSYAQWPEFEGLTDVQAARVYRLATKVKESPGERAPRSRTVIPIVLGVFVLLGSLLWFDELPSRRGRHPIAPLAGVACAFIGGFMSRARGTSQIRNRVRHLIQRCTCSCGYSMLGLPSIVGAHPPAVRCPECGATHLVRELPAEIFDNAPNIDR